MHGKGKNTLKLDELINVIQTRNVAAAFFVKDM